MDTAKVQVYRTKHGEETVTGFAYLDGDGFGHFVADETEDEFEMTAAQAAAAVATGGFAVSESSKSEAQTTPLTQPE